MKDLDGLIGKVTKTVNHEIKKGEFLGALLAPLAALIVQPVISSAVNGLSGRRVRKWGRRYIDKKF